MYIFVFCFTQCVVQQRVMDQFKAAVRGLLVTVACRTDRGQRERCKKWRESRDSVIVCCARKAFRLRQLLSRDGRQRKRTYL
jgi:hypothetical protein